MTIYIRIIMTIKLNKNEKRLYNFIKFVRLRNIYVTLIDNDIFYQSVVLCFSLKRVSNQTNIIVNSFTTTLMRHARR